MNPSTLPLDSELVTLASVGGKGLNLARLARAGFPVPAGFLITTAAYQAFTLANHLEESIDATLESLDQTDPRLLESASTRIRGFFTTGSIPESLLVEILAAYRPFNGTPLAVRSSATAEDLPEMSFAGQQDTFLNVVGISAFQQALIACWSSLWTARAIGYRARNGIPQKGVALAVVAQEMVQSEASGVLFTANPLDGIRHQTAIDATLGLGEALVGGHVEPDNYLVDTQKFTILRKELGNKKIAIRSAAGGGVETVEIGAADRQAIPDSTILALSKLGRQVQEEYDFPQDIEWATVGEDIYLLQSRPITSLYPLPELPDERLRVFFSFGAVQGILDPLTPLGQDAIRHIFAGGASLFGYDVTHETQGVIKIAGERLWGEMTTIIRNTIGKRIAPNAFSMIEPSMVSVVRELADDPRLAPERRGVRLSTVRRLLGFFPRNFLTVLRSWANPASRREKVLAISAARLDDLRREADRILQDPDLDAWDRFEKHVDLYYRIREGFPQVIPNEAVTAISGIVLLGILHRLAREAGVEAKSGGISDLVLEIARGLPHNVTTGMDLSLWRTAQAINHDPESRRLFESRAPETLAKIYLEGGLPPDAKKCIGEFLAEFGMRAVGEIDIGRRRWREDPTPIMETIKSYMQIPTEHAPDVVFKRGEQAAELAIRQLLAQVRGLRGGWLKSRLAAWAATRFRALSGLRESPKFHLIRMMGTIRHGLLASGVELAQLNVIKDPGDLFFLYYKDLRKLARERPDSDTGKAAWMELIRDRKDRYQHEKLRKQIPRLMLSDGRAFYEGLGAGVESQVDGVMTGSPVSPGVSEGKVRVVFDPHHADLRPGEILVCPGTDPAWTPLFLAAAGLVMEVGGMMTHGSVVAREYGIPAVVGVYAATTRLQTGMRIRLNGSIGKIEILDD